MHAVRGQEADGVMEYASGHEVQVGDHVTWTKQSRGGYGYTSAIPGWVVRVGPARVCIAVERANGYWMPRWVRPGSIALRGVVQL